MAHFAEIDSNNKVLQVIVIDNVNTSDINGIESEEIGVAYCKSIFGVETNWIQTSYNKNFRNKFASIDDVYLTDKDIFVAPQPYSSWVLGEDGNWNPPFTAPQDDKNYKWDEETQSWVDITPAPEPTE